MAYDIAAEESTVVLRAEETNYEAFDFNASWSPDSRRICVVGTKANGDQELLIIDLAKERNRTTVRHKGKRFNADSTWHPSGHRIVFSMFCEERQRMQLYECDPDTMDSPKLVKGQTQNLDALDATCLRTVRNCFLSPEICESSSPSKFSSRVLLLFWHRSVRSIEPWALSHHFRRNAKPSVLFRADGLYVALNESQKLSSTAIWSSVNYEWGAGF